MSTRLSSASIRSWRRIAVAVLPLGFLTGCASMPPTAKSAPAPPSEPSEIIVGAGDKDQRKVITASDERMYDAEHGMSPDAPTPTDAPGQGIP